MIIDVSRLLGIRLEGVVATGVDRVTLAYLAHYKDESRALVRYLSRWMFLSVADSHKLFTWLLEPDDKKEWHIRLIMTKAFYLNWSKPKRGERLLNVSHSGLEKASYKDKVKQWDLRPVYFLHDLIPITHAEYVRANEFEKHHKRLDTLLSTADLVVVNSQLTHDDLVDYANALRRSLPQIVLSHLAPAVLPPASDERPLDEHYFVMLGTIEPRKNHILLLNIWRMLNERYDEEAPKLVIIGKRGWEFEHVEDMLERCSQIRGSVIEISSCSDEELANWLKHAQALLFPSFVEGFGMPLVEALCVKTPVIASDLEVFKEVAGDIPEYIDPLDGKTWMSTILEYNQSDSKARALKLSQLSQWSAPTWQAHFNRVDKAIRQLDQV